MSIALFDPEAIIDAMAPLLGIDIRPDHRAAVAVNLRIAAGMAAQVLEVPMGDHVEPAALFVPGLRHPPGDGVSPDIMP